MSNADVGQGTTISFPNGWSGEIVEIDVPDESVSAHKVTVLTDEAEEYIAGRIVEGGELSLKVNLDKGAAVPQRGLSGEFEITYPLSPGAATPAARTFRGIVTSSGGHNIQPDGVMQFDTKIKVNGKATFVEET